MARVHEHKFIGSYEDATEWLTQLKPTSFEWGIQWVTRPDFSDAKNEYDVFAHWLFDGEYVCVRAIAYEESQPSIITHRKSFNGDVWKIDFKPQPRIVEKIVQGWCEKRIESIGTPNDWTEALRIAARISLVFEDDKELETKWITQIQKHFLQMLRMGCPHLDDDDAWRFAPDSVVCCEDGLYIKDPALRFLWCIIKNDKQERIDLVPYDDSLAIEVLWNWMLSSKFSTWRLPIIDNNEKLRCKEFVFSFLDNIATEVPMDEDKKQATTTTYSSSSNRGSVAPMKRLVLKSGNETPLSEFVKFLPPCINNLLDAWKKGQHIHYPERLTVLLFLFQTVTDPGTRQRLWFEAARNDPDLGGSGRTQAEFYKSRGKIAIMSVYNGKKESFARGCKGTAQNGQCPFTECSRKENPHLTDIEDIVRVNRQKCGSTLIRPFTFYSPIDRTQKAMEGSDAPQGCITS